jgi:formylglycine-generating enzyme required for sulfatase activity
MKKRYYKLGLMLWLVLCFSCRQNKPATVAHAPIKVSEKPKQALCCESNIPSRFASLQKPVNMMIGQANNVNHHAGMIYIKPGTFMMGGDNKHKQATEDEFPKHKVIISDFWMDAAEVTNSQFRQFVTATGYVTTAEQKPDWDEMKKQLPPRTSKPDDKMLALPLKG